MNTLKIRIAEVVIEAEGPDEFIHLMVKRIAEQLGAVAERHKVTFEPPKTDEERRP